MSSQVETAHQLRAAITTIRQGLPGQAIQHLNQILVSEPGHAEAHELLGIACARAGRNEDARRAFAQSTRLDPARPTAHYNFALLLAAVNDLDDAMEENEAALYLAPQHIGALALQKDLKQRLFERRFVSQEGFALVGTGPDPTKQPPSEWARLVCESCGAKNFITARSCSRCGSYIPEIEEIIPVE